MSLPFTKLCALFLCAAAFTGTAHAERLPLKSYTTVDGLPHNGINKIVRDSRGFLWFCTEEGLSRFDGYQQLFAGADAPIPGIVSQASTFNSLQMFSINDTLSGYATGIVGSAARRINAFSGTISSNRLELNLHGTLLQTTTVDLRLSGATTLLNVPTGDDNTTRVLVLQAIGSGPRGNRYADSSIPLTGTPGVGNRLEIVGNPNAFDQTNQNFIPSPPAEFFTGGQ